MSGFDQASSLAALAARFPAVGAHLPQGETVSRLVRDAAGRAIDIDLGGGTLYGGDGVATTEDQLEKFAVKPLQFFTADLGATNLGSPISARMRDSMMAGLKANGIETMSNKPDYEGSFLVVLGVGLGHHLIPLVETTKARSVLICEPVPEFLVHAAAVVDWARLFEIAEQRGITVQFTLADQPDLIVQAVSALAARVGEPFIDGAFVFAHYPSWVLTEVRDRLPMVIEHLFISKGFYEDELKMLTNATANMQRYDFRVIDAKPKPVRSETALIVGSGPSFDRTLPDLKRLSAEGVVFSGGTSLRACLRNGIRPRFHCELENGEPTLEVLSELAREFDFSGITLIASFTVHPDVAALFDEVCFFFRDAVVSTRVLAPPRHEILGAAPTCVNTALRLGAAMGFVDFVLFGTDCGSKQGQSKHAKDTIYNLQEKHRAHDRKTQYNQVMPGNFGGTAQCDWVLALCNRMLADATGHLNLNVLNTADGARIAHTKPKVASSIRRLPVAADFARLTRDLERITAPYRAGEFLARWGGGPLAGKADAFYEDLLAVIDAAIAEGDDLVAFWHRLVRFLNEAGTRYGNLQHIAEGSLRSMPKIGMYFIHRVTDPEKRAKMVTFFLEEYRASVVFMREGTAELLKRIDGETSTVARALGATGG
ncbi:motility associated factor glycosyltransferase family protein [Zavarzinia sp.]|uniref:motility associated factor glycosyltransferase family protein n=1 Tax=Zavarzinia sp. TaxID=2027920 RepID=UPI003564251A